MYVGSEQRSVFAELQLYMKEIGKEITLDDMKDMIDDLRALSEFKEATGMSDEQVRMALRVYMMSRTSKLESTPAKPERGSKRGKK